MVLLGSENSEYLVYSPVSPAPLTPLLTPGEQHSVELETASVLQPTGELAEVTAVQVQGDPQGLSAAFHLVTHWCVCNTHKNTHRGDFKVTVLLQL